jgi:Raf kinase inhibitor-like YbhB/YbcL family protein
VLQPAIEIQRFHRTTPSAPRNTTGMERVLLSRVPGRSGGHYAEQHVVRGCVDRVGDDALGGAAARRPTRGGAGRSGGDVPVKFSQAAPGVATGEGLSPAISWTNVPAGTQSFFLNMRDMDVARNKTTDDQAHWVVWNIPASATGLPEGVPKGPKLANGAFQFSATGQMYRGPGAGANGPKHHYMFELYALDNVIDVQPAADAFETRANVMKAIQGHVLAKAVYGGLFRRPQ